MTTQKPPRKGGSHWPRKKKYIYIYFCFNYLLKFILLQVIIGTSLFISLFVLINSLFDLTVVNIVVENFL